MTRVLERYLSFYGRLGRLPFFIRNIYLYIAEKVLLAASLLLLINGGLWWWLGTLVVACCVALVCVGNASLIARRLHDVGWSGYHTIWVVAAQIGGSAAQSYESPKGLLLGLPLFAIGLWLLFWPGNAKVNRFDTVPG
jgi:uncharacterized membrane protein YhaH (DUF805 family)